LEDIAWTRLGTRAARKRIQVTAITANDRGISANPVSESILNGKEGTCVIKPVDSFLVQREQG
jgi:hypothetical protein